jgi:hypothetical protein
MACCQTYITPSPIPASVHSRSSMVSGTFAVSAHTTDASHSPFSFPICLLLLPTSLMPTSDPLRGTSFNSWPPCPTSSNCSPRRKKELRCWPLSSLWHMPAQLSRSVSEPGKSEQTVLTFQDELGDRLVAEGVNIFSTYGTTETGAVMHSQRDFATDKAWNWVRAQGKIVDFLQMEDRNGGLLECVVKDGWPAKISELTS